MQELRQNIANSLYRIKAHTLPAVCERFGLGLGDELEAMSSKNKYIMCRLEKLPKDKIIDIATQVADEYPTDELQLSLERLGRRGALISEIIRAKIAEALNDEVLVSDDDLLDFLNKHFDIYRKDSTYNWDNNLSHDIFRHVINNEDWDNKELLKNIGFFNCSQQKVFEFLEDLMNPQYRSEDQQKSLANKLNLLLQRDGFQIRPAGMVSGYPFYKIQELRSKETHPSDQIISDTLGSFDSEGVHHAWEKALSRRNSDPEGAITAARTLLESVCMHILDETETEYSHRDDLPKLYNRVAEVLNLAPSQHTEQLFKTILGNCQNVVNTLGTLRNKLSDAHGAGKRGVKPQARHAELAVNLAGTVSMFLVSTWQQRQK